MKANQLQIVIGFSILCLTLATNATAQVQVQIVYGDTGAPSPLPSEEAPSGPSAMASEVASITTSTWIGCDLQIGYFEDWLWAQMDLLVDGTRVVDGHPEGYGQIGQTIWANVPLTNQNQQIICTVNSNVGDGSATGTLAAACGDERDTIIVEYSNESVSWTPSCNDFQALGDMPYNHPEDTHLPWGIVKDVLYSNFAFIQEHSTWWYPEPIRRTSGYRCPHNNRRVGGAQNSRHMYGDALDMTPPLTYYSPPNETEYNRLRSSALQAAPSYITDWSTYADRHLHVDWR